MFLARLSLTPDTRARSGADAVFTSTPTAFTQSSTTASSERDSFDFGQVVLILADADGFRVDLHQLGERVLQAARDGDSAAQRTRRGPAVPRSHRRLRNRPTRPPQTP